MKKKEQTKRENREREKIMGMDIESLISTLIRQKMSVYFHFHFVWERSIQSCLERGGAPMGGGGGYSDIFIHRLGSFFGAQNFKFQYFSGFQIN